MKVYLVMATSMVYREEVWAVFDSRKDAEFWMQQEQKWTRLKLVLEEHELNATTSRCEPA